MSKTLSYKGKLPTGEQDRIRLRTINGKTGYRIKKFQIIPRQPGAATTELVCQIFKTDQTGNITATIDFTDFNLLACAYYADSAGSQNGNEPDPIIFDNEIFNQDIFVTMTDAGGNTNPGNYYIELEAIKLSDLEATMLTLKSLRTIEETI